MVAVVEVAFRRAWLEVRFGEREMITVNLGPEPVKVGGDARACTVWARGAAEIALRYWIRDGKVYCEDVPSKREAIVADGDTRTAGGVTVVVRTGSAHRRQRSAAPRRRSPSRAAERAATPQAAPAAALRPRVPVPAAAAPPAPPPTSGRRPSRRSRRAGLRRRDADADVAAPAGPTGGEVDSRHRRSCSRRPPRPAPKPAAPARRHRSPQRQPAGSARSPRRRRTAGSEAAGAGSAAGTKAVARRPGAEAARAPGR